MTWIELRDLIRRGRQRVFGPAGIYFGATFLARAGAIFLIPLYTRRLSRDEYGDYALAQTIVAFLPTFLSLGLLSAVARYYYDEKDVVASRQKAGAAARAMVAVTLVLAVVTQAAIVAIAPAGRVGLSGRWELSCILWAGVGSSFAGVPAIYLRAAQRPFAAAAFQIGQFVSNAVAGIVLVVVMQRHLRGAIEASALAFAVDGLLGLVFIVVVLKGQVTRQLLRESLRFSLPFVPHFAANQLQQISDRWTLKLNGMPAALGSYALAGQLSAPTFMAVIAWNDADTATMGEIFRERGLRGIGAEIRRIRRAYMIAAALPGVLITLSLPLLAIVVGQRFSGALWMIPFMCASMIVECLYFPYANVVFFASRTSVIPKITIFSGLLNVVLNIALIPLVGVAGAIAARAVSMSCRSLAMWWAARKCLSEAMEGS